MCDKIIKEKSNRSNGEECIFCEGSCQGWIHRHCAGIPKPAFEALNRSQDPFLCVYCSNFKICELKQSIQALENEVTSLKTQVSDLTSTPADTALSSPVSVSYASALGQRSRDSEIQSSFGHKCSAVSSGHKELIAKKSTAYDNPDRKFRFVMYGIKERSKGSPRHLRLVQDNKDVAHVIRKLDDSIPEHSIQDCSRLGRFSEERCRPILVKMSRSCEVSSILAQRRKLKNSPGIVIKPDLSPADRKINSILLKERWSLMKAGTSRDQIRIMGNAIFVRNTKYGTVENFVFKQFHDNPRNESVSASQNQTNDHQSD